MNLRSVVPLFVLGCLGSAWSSACTEIKGDPSGGDGGLAADGAPLPGVDGGASSSDGGADGSSGVFTDYGMVSLSYADYGTVKSFTGFAQFQKTTGALPGLPPCQSETEGECVFYQCGASPQVDAGAPLDAGTVPPHAGVITVSGARIPAGTTLVPGADGKYPVLSRSMLDAWSGGEALAVSAAGGNVPAFDGTVSAPAPGIALTAPVLAPPQKAEVDRSRGLTVSWSGGGAGTLTVSATAAVQGGGSALVTCRFDAAKGTGQMPTKLLSKLPAGDGGFGASISSTTQLKAGPYTVTVLASSSVKNATGQVTLR